MLDVDRIRADFPILHQQVNGHPLVYLDNAATTQKPRQVIDALSGYYERDNANIHRGIHTLAQRATEQYEGTRAKVARFIGAPDASAIIFTRNTTEALNLVAHGLSSTLTPGDEIVVSAMEHHSNIVPWQMAAARTGAVVRWAGFDAEGQLNLDELRELIGPRTKIVSLAHASNVLGTINPIAEVAAMTRAAGARLVVDGAQSAPHLPVDVQSLGCDFFAFSAHKMLGPTGVGVLWANPETLNALPPFLGGGDMIEYVREEGSTWADLPHKFEAGTPNIADVIAFGAAIEYLEAFGIAAIRAHEIEITGYAMERLWAADRIWWGERTLTIHGPTDPEARSGLVSFTLGEVHPHDVSEVLDQYGVAIRAGHHCAQPLMRRLGVHATNRASFALYNTKAEVDAMVDALHHALEVYAR